MEFGKIKSQKFLTKSQYFLIKKYQNKFKNNHLRKQKKRFFQKKIILKEAKHQKRRSETYIPNNKPSGISNNLNYQEHYLGRLKFTKLTSSFKENS